MALASNTEGVRLTGAGEADLGSVYRVLYDPEGTRAVGLMIRPTAMLYVVDRPDTFLPLDAVRIAPGSVACDLKKLPTGRRAAEGLGLDPEKTVIWTGMTVRGTSGGAVGIVSDVEFGVVTGDVRRIEIAGGAVADAAVGRFVVEAGQIEGYRDGAIVLTVDSKALVSSGGLAKTAAEGVVAASEAAKAAGGAIEDTVIAASHATGRAIKAVSDAKVAEKTVRRVRNTWRDSVKAFREGMDEDK
jgi:sporulation protein YlmC with PRC-barrel domain